MIKFYNTGEAIENVPVYMLIYGNGGIGKTTFAAGSPAPLMADCENGAKFLGRRGIKIPVAPIETWYDFAGPGQFVDIAIKSDKVSTIVVDPIGELMEKCKHSLTGKLVNADGGPTLQGWGEMSSRMKEQFRKLRDSGKNVILVAHVEEKDDDGRMVKRPKIQTRISEDIINMVDIVAYMESRKDAEGNVTRVLSVDPTDDRIAAKDRTSALPSYFPPDFEYIQDSLNAADEPIAPKPKKTRTTKTSEAVEENLEEPTAAPTARSAAQAKLEQA